MKKVLVLFLVLFAVSLAFSDDVTFQASVDKNSVPLNDAFVYSVTISGDMRDIPQPQIGDLSNFNQFSASKSQSMSIINGKVSASVTHKYTLGPKSVGRFTIPAATVVYKNKTYTTQSIEIEVTPAQSVQYGRVVNTSRQQQDQQSTQQVRQNQKPNFYVKASVNKKTVYENEKLIYKFSFYRNVDLMSNPEHIPPDFGGFWNDGSVPKNHMETIDGVLYAVSDLETTLYPIASGMRTITPTMLKIAAVNFVAPNDPNDLMQVFLAMTGQQQVQQKLLETQSLHINVLPLPKENRPNDFYGAVGRFNINASIDRAEIAAGDTITLFLTIGGDGNMKSVTRFDINLDKGLKKYDTMDSGVNNNEKVFTTLITALTPGEKVIPAIRFSYFNPSTKRYESVSTKPIKFMVTGQAVYENINDASSPFGAGRDISYNKPIKNLASQSANYIESKKFYLLFVPFILLLIGGIMFNLFGKSSSQEKSKGSISKAKQLMAKAQSDFAKGNLGGLFDLVYRALMEAIDAKTLVASTTLQEKQIIENLKAKEVSQETITKLSFVFEQINFYKFAAVRADEKKLKEMIENVGEIIANLG